MSKPLALIALVLPLMFGSPARAHHSGGGGTVIEYITGDRSHHGYRWDHGGRNYHEHLGFRTRWERDRAMQVLRNRGFYIGSTTGGRHAWGSLHYRGLAFDVPFYPNNRRFGYPDNRWGEEKFSYDVRQALIEGNFRGIYH